MKQSRAEDTMPNQDLAAYLREVITHSPQETFEYARSIGRVLGGGEIFLLNGELGAGKTVFAKGLAAGLDIPPDDVNSPTFTLVNIHQGRLKFYHIDLYRVENDMYSGLGLDEVFEDTDNVIAIEWAERLASEPAPALHVELKYVSDSERLLIISTAK